MTKVLVTGGAGFIGSHLVKALLQRGDSVRVLDDFSSSTRNHVPAEAELIEGKIQDPAAAAKAVAGVEFVFHQAAFISVPESIENPAACWSSNVDGTLAILAAAHKAACRGVVLASSAAVYGDSQALPLAEDAGAKCLSPYAASKYFNETLAQLYTLTYGLPVTALRYFNVFGPGQSPTSAYAAAVPKFIAALAAGEAPTIFGDGTQGRDFIFVGDVVRANLLAAEANSGGAFNVCTGQETTLLDLLAALYPLFPNAPQATHAAPRLGDVHRSLGDPQAAHAALGFRAETPLAEGLRQIVEAA
ncbi:MAG TPA: NAD-dependent epimerase/dehydratase family protein [Anaerolineales bacterium]|nr:NAD-dependent epimerase/dehydratase family protein [Anaerolineales bacterium]HRQ91754.1 NAD-dependent epimerase/dehydratase family protein [Anaerolineales bacterium]